MARPPLLYLTALCLLVLLAHTARAAGLASSSPLVCNSTARAEHRATCVLAEIDLALNEPCRDYLPLVHTAHVTTSNPDGISDPDLVPSLVRAAPRLATLHVHDARVSGDKVGTALLSLRNVTVRLWNASVGASPALGRAVARGAVGALSVVGDPSFGDADLSAVAAGAASSGGGAATLRALTLSSTGVGDPGAVALAAALRRRGGGLRTVDLTRARGLGDAGARALASALRLGPYGTVLESLALAGTRVGRAGLEALAEAVVDRCCMAHFYAPRSYEGWVESANDREWKTVKRPANPPAGLPHCIKVGASRNLVPYMCERVPWGAHKPVPTFRDDKAREDRAAAAVAAAAELGLDPSDLGLDDDGDDGDDGDEDDGEPDPPLPLAPLAVTGLGARLDAAVEAAVEARRVIAQAYATVLHVESQRCRLPGGGPYRRPAGCGGDLSRDVPADAGEAAKRYLSHADVVHLYAAFGRACAVTGRPEVPAKPFVLERYDVRLPATRTNLFLATTGAAELFRRNGTDALFCPTAEAQDAAEAARLKATVRGPAVPRCVDGANGRIAAVLGVDRLMDATDRKAADADAAAAAAAAGPKVKRESKRRKKSKRGPGIVEREKEKVVEEAVEEGAPS